MQKLDQIRQTWANDHSKAWWEVPGPQVGSRPAVLCSIVLPPFQSFEIPHFATSQERLGGTSFTYQCRSICRLSSVQIASCLPNSILATATNFPFASFIAGAKDFHGVQILHTHVDLILVCDAVSLYSVLAYAQCGCDPQRMIWSWSILSCALKFECGPPFLNLSLKAVIGLHDLF